MYMSPPDDRELGEYVGERMGDEGDEGGGRVRGGGGRTSGCVEYTP